MKLTFSPASPFARKVRIAAIETGLIDKIEFSPATVAPGQPNEEYSKITPLKKLPVLILDNGDIILDSYVIVEYLDELAGGGKLIPTSGPDRWKVKSDHSLLQGMLDSMLLCRYEGMVRPEPLRWQAWSDDHWKRAWAGMARFENKPEVLSRPLDIVQIGLVCVLGYADFRFADCGWRKAYPKLDAFHQRMLERPSIKISAPLRRNNRSGDGSMNEVGKKLRHLGFAAVFMLTASTASAQLQEFSTGQRNLACGSLASIGDGWPTATPESTGLDGERLCGIAARLAATNANVHAVIVVRRGTLVFEQYFPGYDEPWGMGEGRHDFDATSKHDMRSVSKSVVSLLVGIAIDRELIKSADEPVVKFFPDYSALKSPGWDNITLRHLLTMSSGIQWDENRAWKDPQNDEPHLGNEADPFRYVLSKPIVAPPDTLWNYNGGGTDLLGNVIERVSGKSLDAFAREALFTPLGISDWEWMKYRNEHIAAAAGLRLRPRDAAKIGQLVLNKGAWGGRQIVSAKWIEQSVTPRFQAIGYFGGLFYYGQQWWMGRTLSGDKDVKWIAAQGLGGQRIFIVPELELVMVTTSGLYGSPRQGNAALDILANFIIPYIRDNNTR